MRALSLPRLVHYYLLLKFSRSFPVDTSSLPLAGVQQLVLPQDLWIPASGDDDSLVALQFVPLVKNAFMP